MPDLFVALTAKYLDEHRMALSPATSDEAMRWMEEQLDGGTAESERYLLESYLAFDEDELHALPAPVHDWFLDRWALAGPGTDDPGRVGEIASKIASIFLVAGPGIHQVTAVACLLAFDRTARSETSHVLRIAELLAWASPEVAGPSMEALSEALLDRLFLSPDPETPTAALRDLVRAGVAEPYLSAAMRRRAELVGEPFRAILDEFTR